MIIMVLRLPSLSVKSAELTSTGKREPSPRIIISSPRVLPVRARSSNNAGSCGEDGSTNPERAALHISSSVRSRSLQAAGLAAYIAPSGAAPDDIRLQFLTEALLLSIFGGLIGTLVGIGGAYIFGAVSDMRTVVVPTSILLAFGSAATVGAFFGYYPANKAAQLDPIEALRYE